MSSYTDGLARFVRVLFPGSITSNCFLFLNQQVEKIRYHAETTTTTNGHVHHVCELCRVECRFSVVYLAVVWQFKLQCTLVVCTVFPVKSFYTLFSAYLINKYFWQVCVDFEGNTMKTICTKEARKTVTSSIQACWKRIKILRTDMCTCINNAIPIF